MPVITPGGFIPDEHAIALGHAVAQWNFLEADFDTYHRYLRANPAVPQRKRLPLQFDQTCEQIVDCVVISFPDVPSLTVKVRTVVDQAKTLSEQRNRLLHSNWFWHPSLEPPMTLLKYERDGGRSIYGASLSDIREFTADVKDCHGSLLDIFFQLSGLEVATPLTPVEQAALQSFRNKYLLTFPNPTATLAQHRHRSFRA